MAFELFGDVFGFHHLFDEGGEHLLSIGFNLCAVFVESTLGEKSCKEERVMFLQVVLVQHTPFVEPDIRFFRRECEVGYHIIIDMSVCNVCHNFHPFLL